ncbi:MAG: hypothetical protein LBN22_10055 [Clostridiales Family XIII bacterium]|jgi:hypothetical protein|nr:hypothetical protein [Clostridiales Family XIII bacterium]
MTEMNRSQAQIIEKIFDETNVLMLEQRNSRNRQLLSFADNLCNNVYKASYTIIEGE